MKNHKIVSREEWLVARKEHLAKEKEFTRLRNRLSRQRRELPWKRKKRVRCTTTTGRIHILSRRVLESVYSTKIILGIYTTLTPATLVDWTC